MRFGHCGYHRGLYFCQAVYQKEEDDHGDDDDGSGTRTTIAAATAALPEEQFYSTIIYCAHSPRWLTTAAFRRMTISFVVLLKVRFSRHFFPTLDTYASVRRKSCCYYCYYYYLTPRPSVRARPGPPVQRTSLVIVIIGITSSYIRLRVSVSLRVCVNVNV